MGDLDHVITAPELRMAETTRMEKIAARFARDELSRASDGCGQGSLEAKRQTMRSIARCIWRQDIWAARKLLLRTELGQQRLVVDDGHVSLTQPDAFAESFERLSHQRHDRQVQQAAQRVQRNQAPESEAALHRATQAGR